MVTEGMRLEPNKGGRDRMTLVSHRADLKLGRVKKNAGPLVSEVVTPEGSDYIYQQRAPFQSEEDGRVFSGRAGAIRRFKDGRTELNLFKGERIGASQLQLAVENPNLGVSAAFKMPSEVTGRFFSREGGRLTLTFPSGIPQGARMYVNGAAEKLTTNDKSAFVQLPPGGGSWQLSAGLAVPVAPEITRSVARADGALIAFTPVASATDYRIEISHDGGTVWTRAGNSKTAEFTLGGVKAPAKVHLRVIAMNGEAASLPGSDYPVHVTAKPAGPPEGLRLALAMDEATANWGAVLGAREYRLYRRQAGGTEWTEVYRGPERSHRDSAKGIVPAERNPGLEADALRQPAETPHVYEYAVTAVDDVGESAKSHVSHTGPASWRNWYPDTPLHFKRRSAYWLPPFVKPEQVPPAAYPES